MSQATTCPKKANRALYFLVVLFDEFMSLREMYLAFGSGFFPLTDFLNPDTPKKEEEYV